MLKCNITLLLEPPEMSFVDAAEYMMHHFSNIYDDRNEFCPFCLHFVYGQNKPNYSDSSHTCHPASCELRPYVISRPLQADV